VLDVGADAARVNSSRQLVAFVSRIMAADRAESVGVSADGSPQLAAGALVAEASMRASTTESLEICPWALKEGLMLRKLDPETDGDLVGSSR
jgi:exopolyphosphatase/guanosine-5'-triphosphate,3'-diphosphate pyrophosphatase